MGDSFLDEIPDLWVDFCSGDTILNWLTRGRVKLPLSRNQNRSMRGSGHSASRCEARNRRKKMVDERREYLSEDPPLEDVLLLRRHESTRRTLRKAKSGPKPANKAQSSMVSPELAPQKKT